MKLQNKTSLCALLLIGVALAWTGCVGVEGGGGAVVYGGGPWFRDGVWLDGGGRGWYGGHPGGYVYPRGYRRGGRHR